MKKAMLFVVSFLFAVSANAATLDLTLAGTGGFLGGASQTINSNNSSFEAIGASLSKHSSINVGFGDASPIFSAGESPFTGVFSFTQTVMLTAGTQYFFLLDGIKNVAGYSLSVSAVPIPAALWLFAPALLGFFGLRRKAQNAAVA